MKFVEGGYYRLFDNQHIQIINYTSGNVIFVYNCSIYKQKIFIEDNIEQLIFRNYIVKSTDIFKNVNIDTDYIQKFIDNYNILKTIQDELNIDCKKFLSIYDLLKHIQKQLLHKYNLYDQLSLKFDFFIGDELC